LTATGDGRPVGLQPVRTGFVFRRYLSQDLPGRLMKTAARERSTSRRFLPVIHYLEHSGRSRLWQGA
jgi:hypothetical protein